MVVEFWRVKVCLFFQLRRAFVRDGRVGNRPNRLGNGQLGPDPSGEFQLEGLL